MGGGGAPCLSAANSRTKFARSPALNVAVLTVVVVVVVALSGHTASASAAGGNCHYRRHGRHCNNATHFWPDTEAVCSKHDRCVLKLASHLKRTIYVAGLRPDGGDDDDGRGSGEFSFSKAAKARQRLKEVFFDEPCTHATLEEMRLDRCSRPDAPCNSLFDALSLLPKVCPLVLLQRTAKGLPLPVREGTTEIVLMATPPLCSVAAGAERIVLQKFGEVSLRIIAHNDSLAYGCAHATVDFTRNASAVIQPGSSVEKSVLSSPATVFASEYRGHNLSHLLIVDSVDILLERVRFRPPSLRPAMTSSITVVASTHIFFSRCVFESALLGGHAVSVFNTVDSAFLHCNFSRTDRSQPRQRTTTAAAAAADHRAFERPHRHPATSDLFTGSNSSMENDTLGAGTAIKSWRSTLLIVFKDQPLQTTWLRSNWRVLPRILNDLYDLICLQQRRRHYSRGRPTIAVVGTTFRDTFAVPTHAPPLFDDAERINGAAVTVRLRNNVRHTYVGFYQGCLFENLHGNDASSGVVVVQFGERQAEQAREGHRDCSSNSIKFIDCSFRNNRAYQGAGIHVDFFGAATTTVGNGVEIRRTDFRGNRAVSQGGAFYAHFALELQDLNTVLVERCRFHGNSARGRGDARRPGAAVYVLAESRLDDFSSELTVFPNPPGFLGNASAEADQRCPTRHYRPDEFQNATHTLRLLNCSFTGNFGFGTCHNTRATVLFAGTTRFEGNTGSALVAMNSNITVTGTLVMVNNTAKQGAAIHEGEFATVRLGQVVRIKIRDNRAEDRGGAFYIDSDSSTQSTDERLMYLGQNREHAECPLQFPENLSENDMLVLFDSNKVRSLAQSGFFVGSWQKCYGVLRVTDNPAVAHNETVLIDHQAFCTPFDLFYGLANPCRVGKWTRRVTYKPVPPDTGDDWDEVAPATGVASPAASATFATATASPSSPSPEQRQQRQLHFLPAFCADFTGLVHRWLRMISQSASRSANSSTGRPVVRDIPPGGTATPLAKFLDPAQNPICKSVVTGWTVVNKVDLYKSKFSTQAAWIFFNKATTSCFKHIGERVWYFRDACSRVAILSHARKMSLGTDTLGLRSTTDMSLVNLALKHYRYRASAPPVLPGPELTMTPWADALHRSYQQTAHLELEVDMDQEAIAQYLHSYSDLTLNPAPGEVFDLDLTVTDELVNLRSATLSVKVESNGSNVLLGQGSRQYSPDESVLFSTGQSNWALSLLGVPGSKGVLIVTVEGDYNQRPSADEKLVLAIPFLLRRCHLGFYPPHYTDPTEASHYVRNFTECRKTGCDSTTVTAQNTMPNADRAASAGVATTTASTTAIAGVLDSSLTCRCPGAQGAARLKGVEGCERGRQINIRRDFWAGVGRRGVTEAWRRERVSEYGRAAFDALQSDPYGRDDAGFNIAPCENGLCSEHNLTRTWPVGDANPCNPAFKRVGPLCGSCEPGTYVLPSSEGCVPCHHKLPGGIPAYVVLVILLTTLVFVVLIIFDIGVTPTLDSWLFFIQAVFCLYPDNLQVGAIFYNMLTYGFGQLCVSEDLDRIGAKTLLLVQPLLLFALLLVFQLMGKFAAGIQVIEKVFRLHSNMAAVPRVLWLCILYSSSALAYVALTLITCVRLDTNNGNETMVLFMDGSVECFQGTHRSYAAVAILILVIFIVPPQVFLTVAPFMSTRLSEAFLLHFYHKACDMYSDTCKWWAAVSLLRRLAFAVLLTVVTDGAGRRLAMTVVSLLLLGAHATYRPFAKTSERKLGRWDVDNNFESFVLLDLSLLCVLRLVISDFSFDEPRSFAKVAFVPLFCAPTVLALVLFLIRQVPKWRARLQARKTRSPGHDAALGHAPGAEMEDSVEEDPLMHYNASQRQASRTVKEESKRAAAVNDCKYPIRIPLLMWSEES